MLDAVAQPPGDVAVVIVSFNSKHIVRKALEAVSLQSYFHAVFGSEDFDESQDMLKQGGCWFKSRLIAASLVPLLAR